MIAASTGNHGQSVAYAAGLFGVRAVICMPERANPVKVESMRALGAEVIFHGRDFDEAREYCEELAAGPGYRYIHSGDEPALLAGVATSALEILEERPDTEVIVPGGRRERGAGASVVARAITRTVGVIGVQSGRTRSVALLDEPARWSGHRARSPRGWPPVPRSRCRSGH